jgi:hypothetical protein
MNNVCDDEEDDGVEDGMMWSEVGCRSLETSTAHAKLSARVLARYEFFFKKKNKTIKDDLSEGRVQYVHN